MRISAFNTGGYSAEKYRDLIGDNPVHVLIGSGAIKQPKFVDGKPTDKIDATKLGIYIEGVGADTVKLPADFDLPTTIKDMDEVTLDNPEACEVKNNVYFRASGIKQAK